MSRRDALKRFGPGLGSIALCSLLSRKGGAAESEEWSPPSGKPHLRPRAKNVIWVFLRGGLSHLESFDPKPALAKYAGRTIGDTPFKSVQDPERLKRVRVVVVNDANGQQRNRIFPTQIGFQRYGVSGTPVSDWFPHLGRRADDFSVIRSMWTSDDNHGAQVEFHSGRHMLDPRVPTIGAWISYGLGTLNEDLPRFISMGPRFFDGKDGHYLGPAHDAVPIRVDGKTPLAFARPELDVRAEEQRVGFDLVGRLGRLSAKRRPDDALLDARLRSYELAFRMQTAVPQAMDFSTERAATRTLYGFDRGETKSFGRQLLAARRFVERGVRFVQIMHGGGAAGAWDAHSGLKANHKKLSAQVDLPLAGLLQDLKERGLLDETIVVLATEFGRTPGSQNSNGRDHHPYGFSVLMAGGGVQGGLVHGATDELGFHAAEHPHYVTDVHATVLQQLGLDPRALELPSHKRLEIEFGEPIEEILA
ncbi:MAG: DUF1501 domain-containing protein [Planctomycetota bacterium]